MGRRQRKRGRGDAAPPPSTTDYPDADGNVLTLRDRLSDGTVRQYHQISGQAAATGDDVWQRRQEFLFERLAVRWEIAGLPLEGPKQLLGRYRMATAGERRWVRETIDRHLAGRQPELLDA